MLRNQRGPRKTHCVHGHPRTPETVNKWGSCLLCHQVRLGHEKAAAKADALTTSATGRTTTYTMVESARARAGRVAREAKAKAEAERLAAHERDRRVRLFRRVKARHQRRVIDPIIADAKRELDAWYAAQAANRAARRGRPKKSQSTQPVTQPTSHRRSA